MKSKHSVIIHPESRQKMRDAALWYESQKEQIGISFLEEINSTLSKIQESPGSWLHYSKETKRLVTKKFPYSVVYFYDEEAVYILATAHHKRKPFYWKDRKF